MKVGTGEQLGASIFNALYGNRVDDTTRAEQDDLGAASLGVAAVAAARIGATVLVEPISGPKPYPLRPADDAVAASSGSGLTGIPASPSCWTSSRHQR